MKAYTYFNSKLLYFHDEKGDVVEAPSFVKRAAKNYRYNHSRNVLQKKCIECKEYFNVKKYEDGKFIDIHDEKEIHYYSEDSGYATRCVLCNDTLELERNNLDERESTPLTDMVLSEDNLIYIRIVAVIENQTEKECLNSIMDMVRRHNTLSYDYVKKIK